jgi:ankyrin repeat protein
VDVNLAGSLGCTPLQAAVFEGDHIAAQMLVRHAAIDINHQNSRIDAPLLLAVKRLSDLQSVLMVDALLLHSELDFNISDSNGQTALWHAVNRGHYDLVKLLLRQSDLRLSDPDRYGVTPLARAAERPVLSVLELLLEQRQICINSQSTHIVPPLWSTCRAGNSPAVEAFRSVQANQKGPTGTTPLQVAVHLNYLSTVSLLLRQRYMVDINARGRQQWTATIFAASHGYVQRSKHCWNILIST